MSFQGKLAVIREDITRMKVDAIVNAANTSLLGGGGVDGAIHCAAGPELQAACKKLGGCPVGEAKATPGFDLPAKWVVHTVGPVWVGGDQNEASLLANCYRNALAVARDLGAITIAFPAISTGAFRFPVVKAAVIAMKETYDFLKMDTTMEKIWHVCFTKGDEADFRQALAAYGA